MAQQWEYDGVDLTTYAYTIRWLGAPLTVPARRGENLVIPHKTGRAWVDKRPEQRIVTLAMWVRDVLPNTGAPGGDSQMLTNLDTLRGLFARDGQHTLKHQFGLVTRQATAEVVDEIVFEPQGADNVYFLAVDFLLADPWWYAELATTVGPTTITGSPQSITVTNAGSRRSEKALFTITGAITNPRLTIGSYWVQYTGTVASGQTLTIDCSTFTATLGGADVSGEITHEGGVVWLPIPSGANTMVVTGSGIGGATVTAAFTAAYA